MDSDNSKRFESVFSKKIRAGKRRTYFFDVRQTKGNDYYLTLTESTRKFNGDGYERHKIFLYKEDFNRFEEGLGEALDYVRTELMPDYDYDEYKRRHEEYEKRRAEEEAMGITYNPGENKTEGAKETTEGSEAKVEETVTEAEPEAPKETTTGSGDAVESEDDMSW